MLDGLFPDLEYYGITSAAARRAGDRREGVHAPPGVLDPLPVQPRGGLHHHRAARRGAGLDVARATRTPSTSTTGRCGSKAREAAGAGQAVLLPRPAELCQVCQIPMGFTEPGDPTTHLRSGTATTRASGSTSAPTAASGSSTASRRSTSRRGCRCTRSTRATAAGRPSPTCWTGTACRTGDGGEYLTLAGQELGQVARARHARIGGRDAWPSRRSTTTTSRRGPPGALRRRPARQRLVDGQPCVRRGGCFRAPKAMPWARLRSRSWCSYADAGPRLRPVDARRAGSATARPFEPRDDATLEATRRRAQGPVQFRT